ncbi:sodium:proton antiporter [Iodidimonas gelatinilytica]|uniref:Sodium:proton antiporter n=1 Tax=Iodidimonas gelatinilytica TaxID=1236966 RepID=A0A5A7MKJ9_9PROT|nr:monovalent cation/H(+) antiporter subunit G [Iodidimonas gelatinilytica]GEQ96366.1 sodium:proton antiporter [Iodidimonas gelatinilytica]GER00313.1 sodium:proton antiporter [Iodidimonas gelatinilytica]
MMEQAIDIISWICLIGGALVVLIGGIGLVRFPDLFTRIHAASLADSGGAILVIVGCMLQAGLTLAGVKLAAILLFLLFTSPTAGYALAHSAITAKDDGLDVDIESD